MERIIETVHGRFVIRLYQAEDEKGVLSLWKAAFDKEMTLRLWRWKYLEDPYGHQIILCVSDTGVPVAIYSGIPYRANWRGETVRFTHLMDNSSHPAYRSALSGRTGLFVRTANAFYDHYGRPHALLFTYGFPGKRHFMLGEKLFKYRAFPDGVSFMVASTADLPRKIVPFYGKIERVMTIDSSFDHLWEACRCDYPLSVIRDAAFVGWRFMDHPEREYELWGYRSYLKKEWKAYAVFSAEDKKIRLIDMLAPSSSRLVCDFLGRMGAEFANRGIEMMETWFPAGHFLSKYAVSAGFVPFPEPLGIIPTARIFDHSPPFSWMAENIFFTMADGDLF
ncbi:MAG: GNAT family N-acetyltransferase [Proteobacteria bacterium]|nr:GNAT family N-acetyltransferase [Pseudomonadota bacterium]